MPRPEPSNRRPLVVLMGSGRSVADLRPEETAALQRADCIIGLNKYIFFYDIAGIRPTHVWFTEDHPPGPAILAEIFRFCRRNRLHGLTFILKRGVGSLHSNFDLPRYWKRRLSKRLKRLDRWQVYRLPPGARVDLVRRHDWLEGGDWANSLDEKLFHLRTSFTCALNYVSVRYPGSLLRLVGTDFNSPGYFFEGHLDRIRVDATDWTTTAQRQAKTHFAAIEHQGTTVFDAFPYMKECLDKNGVRVVCANPESEVVRRGLAEFEPVLETRLEPSGART